jgi:hypothetical protein
MAYCLYFLFFSFQLSFQSRNFFWAYLHRFYVPIRSVIFFTPSQACYHVRAQV